MDKADGGLLEIKPPEKKQILYFHLGLFDCMVVHRLKAEYLNTKARSLSFIRKIGKKSASLVKVHVEALVVSSVGRDCCKGFKYYHNLCQ